MQPEIEIFGASIPTFPLMIAAGTIVAILIVARRFKELGRPTALAEEGVFVSMASGLVGARIWSVLGQGAGGEVGVASLLEGGGLVWYGGLIGGAIGVLVWARARRLPVGMVADVAAPGLAASQAIARIGCQLAGDGDYGVASSLPWAMAYPDGTVPTPPGVTVHPTPVYETLALGLIAIWLWRRRDSFRPGALFCCYLVLAGAQRFLVEFIRLNDEVAAGLTLAQLVSLALIAIGAGALVALSRTGGVHRLRPEPG